MSSAGMMPPPNTMMSAASASCSEFDDPPELGHVRAGEHRQADRVRVLGERGRDDLFRGLVQPGVDDLHAGVAQGPGDDLDAPVVTVEPGFGHDHPDLAAQRSQVVAGRC